MSDQPEKRAVPDLQELLGEHLPALRAFARLRVGHKVRAREDLDDIVQTVCREALGSIEAFEFRGEQPFRNWLFTLVKRKLAERDRYLSADKRDVGREVSNGLADAAGLLDAYATFTTPSMHVAAAEEVRRIEAAFAELSEEQREVITLVRVAGLSHAEAATAMGRSEDSSRQLLRRALTRLTLILER